MATTILQFELNLPAMLCALGKDDEVKNARSLEDIKLTDEEMTGLRAKLKSLKNEWSQGGFDFSGASGETYCSIPTAAILYFHQDMKYPGTGSDEASKIRNAFSKCSKELGLPYEYKHTFPTET